MRVFTMLFFLLLNGNDIYAQRDVPPKAGSLVIGSSVTYRPDDEEGPSTKIIYQDLTWNLNASVVLKKNLRLGGASLIVFEKDGEDSWENFFMVGPTVQGWAHVPELKGLLVAETGMFYGNFAPVDGSLVRKSGTLFFDAGLSYELYFNRKWAVEIGGNIYAALGRIENKDVFFQYIIGVNYVLNE